MNGFINFQYWVFVTFLLSGVFMSTADGYSSALMLSVATLPGVITAKFFIEDISFTKRLRGVFHMMCLAFAVLIIEYLCIILVDIYLINYMSEKNADLVFNPFFIWLIIIAFLSLEKLLESRIKSMTDIKKSKYIEFISDRKRISIEIESIVYIESCDDEVWIRTNTDTSYRTKRNISNWQMALDSRFIRIHRSYLVNRSHITKITPKKLYIGNKALDISRKYREGNNLRANL